MDSSTRQGAVLTPDRDPRRAVQTNFRWPAAAGVQEIGGDRYSPL